MDVPSHFQDAMRTIMREEGWSALYRGIVPSLFLVLIYPLAFFFSSFSHFSCYVALIESHSMMYVMTGHMYLNLFTWVCVYFVSVIYAAIITTMFAMVSFRDLENKAMWLHLPFICSFCVFF